MDADKTPSKENPQYHSHVRVPRRNINNKDLRWFLYGAVPVVIGGLLLIGMSIIGTCTFRIVPDALNICLPPEVPTEIPTRWIVPPIVTTPPITITTPPIVTTPPIIITTPPIVTTPAIAITTPPVIAITLTSSVDPAAVSQAKELSPQFSQRFNVQLSPVLAKGLDAAQVGGESGQLAGMVAPVSDEKQQYRDRGNMLRQVMGIFSLNDPHLTLESVFVVNKATFQPTLVPVGVYMLACHPDRPNDCIAVSIRRQEFQINPNLVSEIFESPVLVPMADYEYGSIKKCFKILKRKICIKVF